MGGSKKASAAQMEKRQDTDKSKEQPGKKDKKDKKGEKTERKAEITVIVNEDQALKLISSNKYLTAQELARQTGVKISAANACLVNLVKKGSLKRTGGFSGHWIYQPAGQ
jgi:small subunit ribosomal protein S25e